MNEYLPVIFKVLDVLIYLAVMRASLTFVHELGHGLAYLSQGKQKVTIFLGTWGDRNASYRLATGRIELWIIRNPAKWKGGLCVAEGGDLSVRGELISILAGPFASLFFGLVFLAAFFIARPTGLWQPLILLSAIAGGMSFLYNMSPSYAGVVTGRGSIVYNDGYQAKLLRDAANAPAEYEQAMQLYSEEKYAQAIDLLEGLISNGTKNAGVYRAAVVAHIETRNFTKADEIQKKQIQRIGNIDAHDRMTMALLKTRLGSYEDSVRYCRHLLQMYGENKQVYNILGHTLNLLGRCLEALPSLERAIELDGNFADAYSNRAYAKMRTGDAISGRHDAEKALQLQPSNAGAHMHLGVYYLDQGLCREAADELEQAKALDPALPMLDKYMYDAHSHIARLEK